ncbi:2OG-Fe(II) oxygenase family protein [Kribbella solani]|uniref:Isopenicillin N synthase-like dioxygenase n=1 Tax=Kribbella solani TaxID=236067 RepID=A0A841DUD1_9ACTN|nr:2OG-Fe(II) oxygenase family protein [Kribbella solani]MBB5979887.1 isopenicillin N synthase-like dioxygenase [Kribbella solani]
MTIGADILGKLRARAQADIVLQGHAARSLAALRREAARFFMQKEDVKLSHGSEDFNFGFRPYGRQYSVDPNRPDMNESFTYWADAPKAIPNADSDSVKPFINALSGYWGVMAEIVEDLFTALAGYYAGEPHALDLERSSYLEINWYHESDRDLLQDRHEDGHLITLANTDGPGLETELDGEMTAARCDPGSILLMPGSLLTAMTGGDIPPLYHQVRNHRLRRRLTVLFLVNPPLDRVVTPYASGDQTELDISEIARTNGAMFGLPPAPRGVS